MNTSPSGDAMTARFHSDADAARLKGETVPWPVAWRIHPDDAARFAAEGKHCDRRRCREPIVIVTWRYWRSTEAGRVLVAEHFVCVEHGREFSGRHGIDLEPEPPAPERRPGASWRSLR